MSADTHDVRPDQYAMVIREMVRHENDVTNHRVMWLLMWTSVLLKQLAALGTAMAVGLGAIASAAAFAALSLLLVGLQGPESSPVRHVDKRGPP